MLEYVGGECTINGSGLHWQRDTVAQSEFHSRLRNVRAGHLEHVDRNVYTNDVREIGRHKLGEPSSTTADLDHAPEVDTVVDPLPGEVPPIGLTERVEVFGRPWLRTASLAAGPTGNPVERIKPTPITPFDVRPSAINLLHTSDPNFTGRRRRR